MDFRRKFEFGRAWRTILLIGSILLIAKAATTPGVRAGLIVAALLGIFALASLWNFIRRTNFLVSRFVESVRFEDYSQRFSDPSGGGFDVLGATLDQALKTLQARHTQESAETRYLAAIVDDAPSALLTLDQDGRIEILNKSARQLFARYPLHRVEDLEELGPELSAAVRLPPGTRKITRLILDSVPQKAIFASAQVARLDQSVTVLSILPVQSELGALEVAAQADLVRVLTHEIMNSLTPVTSLARTGAELVAAAAKRDNALADAKTATFCANAEPAAKAATTGRRNRDIGDYSREGGWDAADAASSGLSKVMARAWTCPDIRISRQSYTSRWRCNRVRPGKRGLTRRSR